MRGVQSRRVRGEQAQLFCTRAYWVMQRFCTILPVYLAHFSLSHDRITWPCKLSALIQQAPSRSLQRIHRILSRIGSCRKYLSNQREPSLVQRKRNQNQWTAVRKTTIKCEQRSAKASLRK